MGDRLEAAAIALKMIAAKTRDSTPYVPLMAERFAVDEAALRSALGSRATAQTYKRIHSNAAQAAGSGSLPPAA